MGQGFAIEFSVDVADDGEANDAQIEKFRVLVADERVLAFEAFVNPFGETTWVPASGRGFIEDPIRIIAWAFDGFVRAREFMKARGHCISHRESPNGIQIIELGTIQRRQ